MISPDNFDVFYIRGVHEMLKSQFIQGLTQYRLKT